VLVPQPLLDLQGLAIPPVGRGEVPPLLGDCPQVVVGGGGPMFVPQPLLDLQGLAIP
jgi:hypothetical protein